MRIRKEKPRDSSWWQISLVEQPQWDASRKTRPLALSAVFWIPFVMFGLPRSLEASAEVISAVAKLLTALS